MKELKSRESKAQSPGVELVPCDPSGEVSERKLGVLQGKASYRIHDDFKMTDEAFLKS